MLYVSPEDWEELNSPAIVVVSDATTNREAVRAIDDWAHEQGFARTQEPYLVRILRDDKMMFQGVRFRFTEAHLSAAREQMHQLEQRQASMKMHIHTEA